MYYVIHFSLILLVLTDLRVVTSTRLKIAILHEEKQALAAISKRNAESGGACSDKEEMSNVDELSFPLGFEDLSKPWETATCAVATSQTVSAGLDEMFALKVPGLNGVTIKKVMEDLEKSGCLSFPYGGCVRDQFLNTIPNDLDMETNCGTEELCKICEEKWGGNCYPCKKLKSIVHIGSNDQRTDETTETEEIDAKNWENTFFGDGTALEYTSNSLAYFSGGLNIILDLTGNGIEDTCSRKIRIPVVMEKWKDWVQDSTKKVYRFWKLRVKDYTAINTATKDFIVEKAKQMITDDSNSFKAFYCSNALLGKWNDTTYTCTIEDNICDQALSKKAEYDEVFGDDLGNFWEDNAKDAINNLECTSCNTASSSCPRSISPTSDVSSATVTTPSLMVPLVILLGIFLTIV